MAQPWAAVEAMQPAVPLGLRERAGGRVAVEGDDRVAEEGADVHVGSVGTDGDDVGADHRPRRATRAAGGVDAMRQPALPGSWVSAPLAGLRLNTAMLLLRIEVA